jgi:hypothetical protein
MPAMIRHAARTNPRRPHRLNRNKGTELIIDATAANTVILSVRAKDLAAPCGIEILREYTQDDGWCFSLNSTR